MTVTTPVEYPGTDAQRKYNFGTHQFVSLGTNDYRCLDCDCRPGGRVSFWVCGDRVPTEQIPAPTVHWSNVPAEVAALARDLVRVGRLDTPDSVLEFFQHPQAWDNEYRWWDANNRPDDATVWGIGVEEGWAV